MVCVPTSAVDGAEVSEASLGLHIDVAAKLQVIALVPGVASQLSVFM